MLLRMAYLVCKVKIFRQRPYVKLGGDLVDALLRIQEYLHTVAFAQADKNFQQRV